MSLVLFHVYETPRDTGYIDSLELSFLNKIIRFLRYSINKRTDTLVFEVIFDVLQIESLKTVVTQYFKGAEPLAVADFTSAEFSK